MKTDKKTKTSREEEVLEGLGVAPGVAIGPAYVRDTGEVAYHAPAAAHDECGHGPAEVLDLEAHAAAGILQRGRLADQACLVSHCPSSSMLATQTRGVSARRLDSACAP